MENKPIPSTYLPLLIFVYDRVCIHIHIVYLSVHHSNAKSFGINTFPAIITCDLTLVIYINQKLQTTILHVKRFEIPHILSILCHVLGEFDVDFSSSTLHHF